MNVAAEGNEALYVNAKYYLKTSEVLNNSLPNNRKSITCLGYRGQSSMEELIHKVLRKSKIIIISILRCYFKGNFRKQRKPDNYQKEKK